MDFAHGPMPYYPDVARAPQNSIIGGASLWVFGGKSAADYKGVAKFFTYLSDTDRQARLHLESGLSADHEGGLRGDQGVGLLREEPPVARPPSNEMTGKEPTENSKGIRSATWCRSATSCTRRSARSTARGAEDRPRQRRSRRGDTVLRQFERTAGRSIRKQRVSAAGWSETRLAAPVGSQRDRLVPDPCGVFQATELQRRSQAQGSDRPLARP